jgi:hypothetical protein
MAKTYRSTTGVKYNIIFKKENGTRIMVSFKGSQRLYTTKDLEIQKFLEASKYFEEKKIEVSGQDEDDKIKSSPKERTSYIDVKLLQEAAEILNKDFGVPLEEMKTPAGIKKWAKKSDVSFPNLEG